MKIIEVSSRSGLIFQMLTECVSKNMHAENGMLKGQLAENDVRHL